LSLANLVASLISFMLCGADKYPILLPNSLAGTLEIMALPMYFSTISKPSSLLISAITADISIAILS
jgi:hypothetical protein